MAELAADKANEKVRAARQARIDAMKAKKAESAKKDDGGEADAPTEEMAQLSVAEDASAASGSSATAAGLQSPTSGAWKETSNIGDALHTVQSPVTSSWKPPAETSLAEGTHAGAKVVGASAEEIQKVESETAIKEEPEVEASEEDKTKKAEA